MKRVTAISLIFVLSLQCIYQLGVLTYFQANYDFISKVLCINKEEPVKKCNGQCFLKKNLDFADETSPEKGPAPQSKLTVEFPVFILTEYTYTNPLEHITQGNLPVVHASLSAGHVSVPFHPPAIRG